MTPTIDGDILDELMSFANAVWGNPQAITKHDDVAGVDYIDLTDHIVTSKFLLGQPIEKILIRQEYLIALDALENNKLYRRAVYVTGQPGIGKTLFLVFILVTHLGQKRPVAWQLTRGESPGYILFRDTASVHPLIISKVLRQSGSLWGLSDSTNRVEQPPKTFYNCVRTIQATSPREKRWKGWSKYAGANRYIMDVWSVDEIVVLAKLLRLDVERMSFLAKEWGGVPRTLLGFLDLPDDDIKSNYKDRAASAASKANEFLVSARTGAFLDDAPFLFYFYRPRVSPDGTIRRGFSRAVIPTATLRSILGEVLQLCDVQVRLDFLRAMSRYDDTRQAADYIYQNWFHSFFCAGETIECRWLRDPVRAHVRPSGRLAVKASTKIPATASAKAPSDIPDVPSPPRKKLLLPTTRSALEIAKPPYYWVAPKSFAAIYGVLVLKEAVYAFQITFSSEQGEPTKDLQKVVECLPSHLQELPWGVVVVGDTDSAWGVAISWKYEVPFSPNGERLVIGWSVVDPVSEKATYEALFDEESTNADVTYLTLLNKVEDEDLTDAGHGVG